MPTSLLRHTPTYSDPLWWSLVLMVHVLNSCSGLPTSGNRENLYNSPRAFGGDKPSYQTVSNIHMLMRHLKNLNNKVLKPWGISIESQCRVDTSCGPKLVGIGCRINGNHDFWSGDVWRLRSFIFHGPSFFGGVHRFNRFRKCSSIFPMMFIDFSMVFIVVRFSMNFINLSMVFIGFSMLFIDSPCCLLICPLFHCCFHGFHQLFHVVHHVFHGFFIERFHGVHRCLHGVYRFFHVVYRFSGWCSWISWFLMVLIDFPIGFIDCSVFFIVSPCVRISCI